VIKRWKMRWARLVARVVGRDCIHGFVERIWRKEKYMEDTEIDRCMILKFIYPSPRNSSETRWNRLLLPWSNIFIKLVVKKNKTQFAFKTHFRKPYSLWIIEYKVLCVYIFTTVWSYWPIYNVIRKWTILQVKRINY
jgi:hypothetical protein